MQNWYFWASLSSMLYHTHSWFIDKEDHRRLLDYQNPKFQLKVPLNHQTYWDHQGPHTHLKWPLDSDDDHHDGGNNFRTPAVDDELLLRRRRKRRKKETLWQGVRKWLQTMFEVTRDFVVYRGNRILWDTDILFMKQASEDLKISREAQNSCRKTFHFQKVRNWILNFCGSKYLPFQG